MQMQNGLFFSFLPCCIASNTEKDCLACNEKEVLKFLELKHGCN